MINKVKNKEIAFVDIVVVTLIFAGPFIWWSTAHVSDEFRTPQFSDGGLLGLIATELMLGSLALCYLAVRLGSLREFAFSITWRETCWGVVLFVAALVVWWVFYLAFGRLIPGEQVMEEASRQAAISLLPIIAMSVVNGVYEEFFLVRFLVEALARHGVWFAVGVSSLVRVAYHFYQGPQGAVSALVF